MRSQKICLELRFFRNWVNEMRLHRQTDRQTNGRTDTHDCLQHRVQCLSSNKTFISFLIPLQTFLNLRRYEESKTVFKIKIAQKLSELNVFAQTDRQTDGQKLMTVCTTLWLLKNGSPYSSKVKAFLKLPSLFLDRNQPIKYFFL